MHKTTSYQSTTTCRQGQVISLATILLLGTLSQPAQSALKNGMVANWNFDNNCAITDSIGMANNRKMVGKTNCVTGYSGLGHL